MTLDSTQFARLVRISAIEMCSSAGAAHIASSLSVADILTVLYTGGANIRPDNQQDPHRDVVVVSKGHAAAALYAALGHAGFFPLEWLLRYGQDGQPLGGHVTAGIVPGVEFSTGSLGHGLPFACGLAYARKLSASTSRVFVVLSDGECDEGSNWEGALFAAHHELSGLTALIDRNGLQSLTSTENTLALEPLADKWASFGWRVTEVSGHDHDAIMRSLIPVPGDARPHVVICRTVKGKGVSFMEDDVAWHYRPPADNQVALALQEILAEE